jgi:aminoglycoside phosphotransferase (APT) family kinase protein
VPDAYKLLRQIRSAVNTVSQTSENPAHQFLLASADIVLNELMLRTDNRFYLDYIARGDALVEEGNRLAGIVGGAPKSGPLGILSGMDCVNDAVEALNAALVALIGQIDEGQSSRHKSYVERVCDWEAERYAHSLTDAGANDPEEADPFTREAFQSYLEGKFPEWPNLKIKSFTGLTGGFSKRTVLFEIEDDLNGPRELILRAEQTVSLPRFSNVVEEYHLIKFAVDSGVPTPDALWLETDLSHFGYAFVVLEKAQGTNYGVTMGNSLTITEPLAHSILDALCAMHGAQATAGDSRIASSHLAEWAGFASVTEATRHYVGNYIPRLIRDTGLTTTPELTRALKWLKHNVPEVTDPPVLIHQDFELNNILIEGEQVTAILDWESACIADPAYDILVMQRDLASVFSMDQFLEQYRLRTGRTISEYNMAYARVAAFAIYMLVYLNGRHVLVNRERSPIAMSMLAYRFIADTAPQLNGLIADAERLRGA